MNTIQIHYISLFSFPSQTQKKNDKMIVNTRHLPNKNNNSRISITRYKSCKKIVRRLKEGVSMWRKKRETEKEKIKIHLRLT